MKAAILTSFDQPPRYGDLPDPLPRGPGEALVEVLAVGLHHITRGRASGRHYSSNGQLPTVAGVDGVGRDTEGRLRYFVQAPDRPGTLAERTVIELDHSIELPDGCDPVLVAGAMNPAMAAWLALRCRVPFVRGQRVLVLGATGASGSMAVQIARHLGASRIVAAGRDARKLARLPELGATDTAELTDDRLADLARDVDVVLDFVWGEPAVRIMEALLRRRTDRGQPLAWIQIGSMAGEIAPIPGAFLRSARLELVGSGNGAVSGREMRTELPLLAQELARGTFRIDLKVAPLREVEQVWSASERTSERIVFTP